VTLVGTAAPTLEPPRCAECGAAAPGRFCADCGAHMSADRDLSVRQYLREASAAITDLDSVLIRSVRALFTEPGRLTVEYLRGNRQRFLPPFRLFLFCNLIYFVAAADFHFTILTTTFRADREHVLQGPHATRARPTI
jgi:hypothetical protein